jgi:hypothetical protein
LSFRLARLRAIADFRGFPAGITFDDVPVTDDTTRRAG